jgi:hypothetical protein
MSINYCTLGSSTVNTFCGNKRPVVLARLLQELRAQEQKPKIVNGGGYGYPGGHVPGRTNPAPRQYAPYRPDPSREAPIVSTELDRIVVSAQFQELSGRAEQEVTAHLDIVYITNLKVHPVQVSVDISNIKVN